MNAPAALITGGTSGIGLATAWLLHERGFQVMVTGRNSDTLAAARKELPDAIVTVRADLRSLDDTDQVVEEVSSRFGSLTALFLNAGIIRPTPVDEVDEATYDDLFATNTKGQFFTLQKMLPRLTDGASIVFTGGIGVTRGGVGTSVAAASRGALMAMVPSLAMELAPRRIRVNAVSPGPIETPIWAKSGAEPDAVAAMASRIPLGRVGTAREVAEAVAFLMSDGASFITGENIVVSGGSGLGF